MAGAGGGCMGELGEVGGRAEEGRMGDAREVRRGEGRRSGGRRAGAVREPGEVKVARGGVGGGWTVS
jgi:hypothetical protein